MSLRRRIASGLSSLGSSPGRGHFVVLFGKELFSHGASPATFGLQMDIGEFTAGVTPRWTSIPSSG